MLDINLCPLASHKGYLRLQAYIVSQMPFPQTLCDFWRLVYDHKSPSIVTIYDFNESQPEDEVK